MCRVPFSDDVDCVVTEETEVLNLIALGVLQAKLPGLVYRRVAR